ncbi:uncharacterized protein CC84DRAFT_1156149 [Paraphaeosphaeria sporulosa]|uniref:Uncharacterized protein n=1 Tax=Paraphaeosphaeria sporulosa TaxID=1460663 RepID=A0A177BZG8_9PLEO|nr:uncharacterized protein CC84DRAFT_1156149 [Paraphaeosphaeria sporulosa]OAG00109.1 hypothetical protein CC84DRAFT_1156149 [Paraphaeosphaeria sporulosa]
MSHPPQRPIQHLLVANRGEIATRILSAAQELSIKTSAIYTSGDASHTSHADQSIELPSTSIFMDIASLIEIVKKHGIDTVHPGYGFLSESAEFARRMWDEAGAIVIGPGWEILEATGDKLRARELAEKCNVPVSPAMLTPTSSSEEIATFASRVGYPIMVKAVDGGGGRGIRLIRDGSSLEAAVKRAVEESPSKTLFAEKAAVDGFRHVEVQIVGDGQGNVTHLWERECSIQRRYQKIIEIAPSTLQDRRIVARIVEDAIRMAKSIHYFSLGTFEFLLNPSTGTYYFLEINPRLQVEHTITETLTSIDIVRTQLLLAQAATALPTPQDPLTPPQTHSIQLRITAENPAANWTLSIGKITNFEFPAGNGIRLDTHLSHAQATVVSASYDSLLAKLIVTASSWDACLQKAQHALSRTHIAGVKTNVPVLRAVLAHPDFLAGKCDTQWLEGRMQDVLAQSQSMAGTSSRAARDAASQPAATAAAAASTLLRKGDAWALTLAPKMASGPSRDTEPEVKSHLEITRVLRNEFPHALAADVRFTTPTREPIDYTLSLSSTSASASATTSTNRRANPADASHVAIPFAGKLVEVLVDEGDAVREGDVVCVVQQMKMELEVRSARSGVVTWVCEADEGDEVGEGTLAAIVMSSHEARL